MNLIKKILHALGWVEYVWLFDKYGGWVLRRVKKCYCCEFGHVEHDGAIFRLNKDFTVTGIHSYVTLWKVYL